MAVLNYRVCNDGNRTLVTITSTLGTTTTYRFFTDGDCNVTERTKILNFQADRAVDTAYTVYYTYTVTERVNGILQEPYELSGSFPMGIGETIKNISVYSFIERDCAGEDRTYDGTIPTER